MLRAISFVVIALGLPASVCWGLSSSKTQTFTTTDATLTFDFTGLPAAAAAARAQRAAGAQRPAGRIMTSNAAGRSCCSRRGCCYGSDGDGPKGPKPQATSTSEAIGRRAVEEFSEIARLTEQATSLLYTSVEVSC